MFARFRLREFLLQASNASLASTLRSTTSLNNSVSSLGVASAGSPEALKINASNGEEAERSAVVFRSESLRSLPTIRVSSPPHLPAALVRSPSRVASVANPTLAGVSRRLVENCPGVDGRSKVINILTILKTKTSADGTNDNATTAFRG